VSRKAHRKSGKPPGRRGTGTGTGEKPTPPWAFPVGIFMVFLSLCLGQATLREIFIGWHRDDYVRDELVVESLDSPEEDAALHGQIASTGDSVTVPLSVAGRDYDHFRKLHRDGQIKGHRVPVWYLPQETPWWLSGNNQVRVIDVAQSGDRFGVWRTGVAISAPLAVVSVLLFLYGLKQLRACKAASAD